MPSGIELQLFDAALNQQANLTNIQALWWDELEPAEKKDPAGKTSVAFTNGTGFITLDLSWVTHKSITEEGFLLLYQLDETDHRDSLIFSGKVTISTVTDGTILYPAEQVTIESIEANPWVRNISWLPLPSVTPSEQKIVGLYPVYDNSDNLVAFLCTSDYTVDWGDGSTPENISSAVKAEHSYDYADVDLAGTDAPVTITAVGDLISRTAHGYQNGDSVSFFNISGGSPITETQIYYVVSAAADTFQISNAVGGSPVTITTDGSATLLPYKQVIVTITPQASFNLVLANFDQAHSAGTRTDSNKWLDLLVSSSNLTSLNVGLQRAMEQFQLISSHSIPSFNQSFTSCTALASIPVFNTSGATSFSGTFANCAALKHLPETLDVAGSTTCASMFSSCRNLVKFPVVDTSGALSVSGMFADCHSMVEAPFIDTSSCTNFTNMFLRCHSLEIVPPLNTSIATNLASMFDGCNSLQRIPFFNTPLVSSFTNMFNDCFQLREVPPLDTSSGLTFSNMFQDCYSLTEIPLLDTSKGTAFNLMFSDCYSLTEIPLLDTSIGINFSSMFIRCRSLLRIPLLDTSQGTNFLSMVNGCTALTEIPLLDTSKGTNFSNMFFACRRLDTIPPLNTSSALLMTSMFWDCSSLKEIPLLDTSLVTNFNSMFRVCAALTSVPALNTSSGTTFQNMFQQCTALRQIPFLDVSNSISTGFTNMFFTTHNLVNGTMDGTAENISYLNCNLSGEALDEIYTNLATVSSKTITVTGNYGTATHTPSIATGKGWTVTV